eukprot:m.196552 g.196552  ORF g.196552 m.196552 type:complete len:248 (-) comp10632_c0_seq2:1197-1940(-)
MVYHSISCAHSPSSLRRVSADHLHKEAESGAACNDRMRVSMLTRALNASGLFCRYFEFEAPPADVKNPKRQLRETSIVDVVFIILMHFFNNFSSFKDEVQLKALSGLGHLCVRHPFFLLRPEVLSMLSKTLKSDKVALKVQAMKNFRDFLVADVERLEEAEKRRRAGLDGSNISNFGGEDSGVSTTLMGKFEQQILASAQDPNLQLRYAAIQVVDHMLRQGLVNPMNVCPGLGGRGSTNDCTGCAVD